MKSRSNQIIAAFALATRCAAQTPTYNTTGFGAGPLDEYDTYVEHNTNPNISASFGFLPWYAQGQNISDWQWRINISQFGGSYTVNTAYDLRWPGNETTLNGAVADIPYLDPIRFCATVVHSYFTVEVTNAFNQTSSSASCPAHFAECNNAVRKAWIDDGEVDPTDGCIRNIDISSIDECKPYFPGYNASTYNLLGNGTRSPGYGVQPAPTLPLTQGKAFVYRTSDGNSDMSTEVIFADQMQRLHMLILDADANPTFYCARIGNGTISAGAGTVPDVGGASLRAWNPIVPVSALAVGIWLAI